MNKHLKAIVTTAMLAALPAQAMAQAATPCVTQVEAQSIVQSVLPDLVTAVGSKCVPALSKSSFLAVSHVDLAARYRVDAVKAWPVAKAAAMRVAPKDQSSFLAALPDDAQRALLSGLISSGIGDSIKTEQCAAFDQIMASLAPLPSSNVAAFVTSVVELSMQPSAKKPGGKPPKLAICPGPAAIPIPQSNPSISK